MTPEEVEPHEDKGHYDVVSDIKVAHAAIPKFLIATFVVLTGWALFYMLTAKPVNDRQEVSTPSEPSVQVGADTFSTSCSACHNPTAERKVGPGLLGVATRLGPAELEKVLHNGRPEKGMPPPPTLGLNETQIQSLKLYLQSLK